MYCSFFTCLFDTYSFVYLKFVGFSSYQSMNICIMNLLAIDFNTSICWFILCLSFQFPFIILSLAYSVWLFHATEIIATPATSIIHCPLFSFIKVVCSQLFITIQWRHNERDGVSNHQPHDCLFSRLFKAQTKENIKTPRTGLLEGIHRWPVNSPHKGPVTRKMFPFDDVIMIYFSVSGFPSWAIIIVCSFIVIIYTSIVSTSNLQRKQKNGSASL